MVSLCGRGFDSLQLHFVSPSRGLTLVRVLCIANIWYAQPLEAFFRRKTFLRFLRFLRDHYFSRRVYSTQIAQIAQKLYLLCTLQEHFSEGKHFCYFCYFLRPVGSKRHPSGCRALRDLKKLRGKSLRSLGAKGETPREPKERQAGPLMVRAYLSE